MTDTLALRGRLKTEMPELWLYASVLCRKTCRCASFTNTPALNFTDLNDDGPDMHIPALFPNAQKIDYRHAERLRHLQNDFPAREISGTLPIRKVAAGHSHRRGQFILSQPLFLPEMVQPCSVGVAACVWLPAHAPAMLVVASFCPCVLSMD